MKELITKVQNFVLQAYSLIPERSNAYLVLDEVNQDIYKADKLLTRFNTEKRILTYASK